MTASQSRSRLVVMADDDRVLANLGLSLAGILVERLDLDALADEMIGPRRPARRGPSRTQDSHPGRSHRGPAAMASMMWPGCARGPARSVVAPDDGKVDVWHVPALVQLGPCPPKSIAWPRLRCRGGVVGGCRTLAGPMTIEVDSTIREVNGQAKQGAAYGYTPLARAAPGARTGPKSGRYPTSASARARPTRAGAGAVRERGRRPAAAGGRASERAIHPAGPIRGSLGH